MNPQAIIKHTNAPIKKYYKKLDKLADQKALFEGASSIAFHNLLDETGRKVKWSLISQKPMKVNGRLIRPDGTLLDSFSIPRGYWEAKDTDDDLDKEIAEKIKKGYPLRNTIFEDTRTGVLYQDGFEVFSADLKVPRELADLLNTFFSYSEPDIDTFEKAVVEFKDRVPELAEGLVEKIREAHEHNRKFIKAFDQFFELCKTSLNPNLSREAVDEMLVQHLLTERLIRKIFDYDDFKQRNVIASEVEKVIGALVSKSFNRREFLANLNRFYVAIEDAAGRLTDFSEKQHFLNTVYESFFQGYSVKVADTHGIVYTPQEIVDFMCASVEEVLKVEFEKSLGDEDVFILDPCTGTGNFIVNIINRLDKRDLKRVYEKQLFANEIMLLPYYIAALNIEHAYSEKAGEYSAFEGLCFVDTLDMAEHAQGEFGFMTKANAERVERQKNAPITVILGNPPYNAAQANENDNNKNRKYDVVDDRIRQTYSRDSKATLKNKLFDPYVKFFRWATDRLNGRDGIVCIVSNNSFVEQITFDGMRKHLSADFTRVYHVDLHGNVRKNPKLSGTTHNVFGIQVGVGITVAVRKKSHRNSVLKYHRVPEDWRKEEKLGWLTKQITIQNSNLEELVPNPQYSWLIPEGEEEFSKFVPIGTKESKSSMSPNAETVFNLFSNGVKTNRDEVVYDFSKSKLIDRIQKFIDAYNNEVDRYKRSGCGSDVDKFVNYERIKWSGDLKAALKSGRYAELELKKVRKSTYRPYCMEYLFLDRILNNRIYRLLSIFPTTSSESDNRVICVSGIGSMKPFHSLIAQCIPCLDMLEKTQCFPFYTYDEDGSNRRENITDWALEEYRKQYKDKKITKWDIFYYVYGLLHHPGYREKYADCLKRELPRIPYAPDFRAFSKAGKKLAKWHLEYEDIEPYELEFKINKDKPLSYDVEDKMRLKKDKTELIVNPSLTLTGIPAEAFEYRLGSRSALDWVVDQYRVKTGKRSGIKSDPNNPDDEQYIVRLVGQVIRVSLETVVLVKSLPDNFGG